MKNVLIFGGSGFIGSHLVRELAKDYRVIVLSRQPEKAKHLPSVHVEIAEFDYADAELLVPYFDACQSVVNLAGKNVGSRWTEAVKENIRTSRLDTDHMIVEAFHACTHKPEVIIQGSGMGVYGFVPSDKSVTEDSPLGDQGILTEVGIAHEQALEPLKDHTRIIHLRTGLVLDGKRGALPKMAASFKMYLGGPTGNGKQWHSWIHIEDEVRAIRFLLENETAEGAFNLTAPNPVQNNEFATALGKAMKRPAHLRTPAAFLRFVMKDMADELLLGGLKIIPKRLLEMGFEFRYKTIEEAFVAIFSQK